MKNLFSLPMAAIICLGLAFSSCKKDDAARGGGSANLDAGKSSVAFNSSTSFAGSTSFSQSNTATCLAVTTASASLRNISLSATEVSGTNTRTAQFLIIVPADASTASGNLIGDLSIPNGATILPTITLSSTNGSTPNASYSTESGTLTITKLTASEIEGTFSGTVKEVGGSATFNLSNGSFAGKF